jgi:hypothetical protein
MQNRVLHKVFSVVFLLFLNLTCWCQNPFVEDTTWGTSERIDASFEEITIFPISPENNSRNDAYFRIDFRPNNEFSAYNIPGCGIDCVINAVGKYANTDKTIQFTINTISKRKGCSGQSVINKDIGTYFWIKDEYSLRLVKNFDDEPKENYFGKQDKILPVFAEARICL